VLKTPGENGGGPLKGFTDAAKREKVARLRAALGVKMVNRPLVTGKGACAPLSDDELQGLMLSILDGRAEVSRQELTVLVEEARNAKAWWTTWLGVFSGWLNLTLEGDQVCFRPSGLANQLAESGNLPDFVAHLSPAAAGRRGRKGRRKK